MSDSELPPELAALERRVAERPRVEPPPDLAPRVHTAVRDALRPRTATWRTWAAVAAAVLLGVNLSMSVAANTEWDLAPAVPPRSVETSADHLRRLAPDLPEAELRRQALLARAAVGLTPTANLTPNWEHIPTTPEGDRWDRR